MTTGEGGMIVTDNDDLAEKIKRARSHGMTSLTWDRFKGHHFSYDVVSPGFNYRIDELRSALGLAQLQRLKDFQKKRRRLWTAYSEELKRVEKIEVPLKWRLGETAADAAGFLLAFVMLLAAEWMLRKKWGLV